jgi:hypothetical protein
MLVIVIAVAAGSYWYLTRSSQPAPTPSEPPSPPEVSIADSIRHPIEDITQGSTGAEAEELPPLDASDAVVEGAVKDLLGEGAALDLVGTGNSIRKIVATVDNLPRDRASARLWPVPPTPGRFSVRQEGERIYVAPENFQRYSPFVGMATSVDTAKLIALYVRLYPLFQQAYEDLGFPGKYFNDRVIDVLDHLLATPDPGDTIELVLPPQDPSVVVERPWVLYRYADPALQSLSAGQKILIRMGSENSRRSKAVLEELRNRLAVTQQ